MSAGIPPEQSGMEPLEPGLDIDLLRRRRERVLAVLALVVTLGASVMVAYYLLREKPADPRELVSVTREAVRQAIGPGVAVQFASPSETQIERLDNDQYRLTGEVVAIARDGRATNYDFDCMVIRRGGSWAAAKLKLNPH